VVIAARPGLDDQPHAADDRGRAERRAGRARGCTDTLAGRSGHNRALQRATIERLGDVEVATLAALAALTVSALAAAGASLPYERWLS